MRPDQPEVDIDGFQIWRGWFDENEQHELDVVAAVGLLTAKTPLVTPTMPRTGFPFSVKQSNLGELGWVSDKEGGYRYQATHQNGNPWAPIPPALLQLWFALKGAYGYPPDACLINYFREVAGEKPPKLGLHRDADEQDVKAPVISMSLGATCIFAMGGPKRSDPLTRYELHPGDAMVIGGKSRLYYHAVDRLLPTLEQNAVMGNEAWRMSFTMRRACKPKRGSY